MAYALAAGSCDSYLKKGKRILNVSTSPSSAGIMVAMLSAHCAANDEDFKVFELALYCQIEGLSSLGSVHFRVPINLLKIDTEENSSITWHSSGNLLLLLLHGNLIQVGVKWLDKKHFNEEISFKEALTRSVHLSHDDILSSEVLAVSLAVQTSLKKLSQKYATVESPEYVTSISQLRDSHSLVVGTSKGVYRVIRSWREAAYFSFTLVDPSYAAAPIGSPTSEKSSANSRSLRCAYKGFQGHVLSRVWEYSQRGIPLNAATQHEEAASGGSSESGAEAGTEASAVQAVEYTYSHISIREVHCLPVRAGHLSADSGTSHVVAIQSDGSLTLSCLSSGEASPGGTVPALVSGHIHPVLLTGYPLPRTLRAARSLRYPRVYERLAASPLEQAGRVVFTCSEYTTEYDALVRVQRDLDAGEAQPHKKVAVDGHCEEEISTVIAVLLSEAPLSPHGAAPAAAGCVLTAIVNTKHMPLAVREQRSGGVGSGDSGEELVGDRMESQSLVQWSVSIAAAANGQALVDFNCLQSVVLSSNTCSSSGSPSGSLVSCGLRLVAVLLQGVVTLRPGGALHLATHSIDCRGQLPIQLAGSLGGLILCSSVEGRPGAEGTEVRNGSIQCLPLWGPLTGEGRARFATQQEGMFYSAGSGCVHVITNHLGSSPSSVPLSGAAAHELREQAEESVLHERLRVPKALVEDILYAKLVHRNPNGSGLLVASSGQVRTTFLSSAASTDELSLPSQDYFAMIPGGSAPPAASAKHVASCSLLYLLNRRTNKWRTSLLSIPSTNTQKDLTMGSNAGAQVGKFSRARLVVQIPHISEVLDGHVNAELAKAIRTNTAEGLRLGQLGPVRGVQEGPQLAPEAADGTRVRSTSFTSITSIASSAIANAKAQNRSRQLTNRSNASIYSHITSSVAIAMHGTHTVVLLTQRKSRYFLEVVSREANKDSLGVGRPQPGVHHLVALPPGFSPVGMTTQDIVRLGGERSLPVPHAATMDPEHVKKSVQFADPGADLDTTGSTHSSAIIQGAEKDRQAVGDKSCAVLLHSADGTFIAYSITALLAEPSASTKASSAAAAGSVADYRVMELFTINVKQFVPTSGDTSKPLEPSALQKILVLPLNIPLFDSQKERHQLFSTLSLPYVCLVLLSSSGVLYVADAYAKALTVVPCAYRIAGIRSVSSGSVLGCTSISESGEGTDESVKCDLLFNDAVVLDCEEGASISRLMWLSYSHNYSDSSGGGVGGGRDDDSVSQIMSVNETDELFFANLHLFDPAAGPGAGSALGARLVSVFVPLGGSAKPFSVLPVQQGEMFTVHQQESAVEEGESGANSSSGALVCSRTSLVLSLLLSYIQGRTKSHCSDSVASNCSCLVNEARSMRSVFRPLEESVLLGTMLVALRYAVSHVKRHSSRFGFLLSSLESHTRGVISARPKRGGDQGGSSGGGGGCPSAYHQLTSCLHGIDAILMLEVVSRLSRRLEPALSKHLFPLCVTISKPSAGRDKRERVIGGLDVAELYELCLSDHLLHYCNRLLSVACEHFGGSESHLTTVISLVISLEHLHLALHSDNFQLVCECVEFCHRLEEMLALHAAEIPSSGSAGDVHRAAAAPTAGRRRRSLSDSYVETVVQNALSQIRKRRTKATARAEAAAAKSASAAPAASEGYYLGKGVVWLLSTTASLFAADAPVPERPSAGRLTKSKDAHSSSMRVESYRYAAVELLTQRLGAHTVNSILCGTLVSSSVSGPGASQQQEPVTPAFVNPSITMCLLLVNLRDLLASSRHYASAAILVTTLLGNRTSLTWIRDHFSTHYECGRSSEALALGAEAKVRRILYVLRLNKVFAHGSRAAIRQALFQGHARVGHGGGTYTGGGIAYSAQYLRRLSEGEKVHAQSGRGGGSSSNEGSGAMRDFSSSFYLSSPRQSGDHGRAHSGANATAEALQAAAAAAGPPTPTPATASGGGGSGSRWAHENSYFELPEDLLERGRTPCAMDVLRALMVGLLLCGEEHCVYLLLRLTAPFLVQPGLDPKQVGALLRELFLPRSTTSQDVYASEGAHEAMDDSSASNSVFFELRNRVNLLRLLDLLLEEAAPSHSE